MLAEIRRLREAHPNLGKRKIHPLLLRFCAEQGLRCPAVATIGRLIADAGGLRAIPPRLDNRGRMRRPRPKKPRKPKGFRAQRLGEVLALDTVIAIRDGVRRYLFGCLDLRSRFALALVTPGFSSKRASDFFFDLALSLLPGRVDRVLSDNGVDNSGSSGQYSHILDGSEEPPNRNSYLPNTEGDRCLFDLSLGQSGLGSI